MQNHRWIGGTAKRSSANHQNWLSLKLLERSKMLTYNVIIDAYIGFHIHVKIPRVYGTIVLANAAGHIMHQWGRTFA